MQHQLDHIRQTQVDAMKFAANRVLGQIEELFQLNIIRQNECDAFRYQVKTIMAEGETLSQWAQARSEMNQIQQLLDDRKQSEVAQIKERMAQLTGETPISHDSESLPKITTHHETPVVPPEPLEETDSSNQSWIFDL